METGSHARILAMVADTLRRSIPNDEETQDRLAAIATRLDGLAQMLRDET